MQLKIVENLRDFFGPFIVFAEELFWDNKYRVEIFSD